MRRTILSFGGADDPRRDGRADAEAVARRSCTEYGIPKAVLREAYDDNPEFQEGAAVSMRKVRMLCRDLGLINPLSKRLWKAKKIWQDD